jgi:hypothetical protein
MGSGVPNDGKRDLPDVSLFASNGFNGSFYVIYQSDQTNNSCNLNSPFRRKKSEECGFGFQLCPSIAPIAPNCTVEAEVESVA